MLLQLATLCTRTLGQFVAFSLTTDLRFCWGPSFDRPGPRPGMFRQRLKSRPQKVVLDGRWQIETGIDTSIPWMNGLLRSASGWKSNLAVEAMLNGDAADRRQLSCVLGEQWGRNRNIKLSETVLSVRCLLQSKNRMEPYEFHQLPYEPSPRRFVWFIGYSKEHLKIHTWVPSPTFLPSLTLPPLLRLP